MERTKQDRADYRSNMRSFNAKLRSDNKTISQSLKDISKQEKKRAALIVDLGNAYYRYASSEDETLKQPCDELCAKISRTDDLIRSLNDDLSAARAERVRHNDQKKDYRNAWKSGVDSDMEF